VEPVRACRLPALGKPTPWRRSYGLTSFAPMYWLVVRGAAAGALLAVILSGCGGPSLASPTPAAPRIAGWLHTSGGRILDSSGRPIRLLGVADGRMVEGSGNAPTDCNRRWQAPTSSDAARIASWGMNFVRLGISWANLEPTRPTSGPAGRLTHHWNRHYLRALDGVVAAFRARGVAVVLDMHQVGWSPAFKDLPNRERPGGPAQCEGTGMPAWLYPRPTGASVKSAREPVGAAKCAFYANVAGPGVLERPQQGLAAVWQMLAERYATDATVIGADLFNEPNPTLRCREIDADKLYLLLGRAIRSVNPRLLLLYEDNSYRSYSKFGFALRRPLPLPNTVYSWHFYPSTWEQGRAALEAHVRRARAWNVPLWIGEFNGFGAGLNHRPEALAPHWATDLRDMLDYCRANGVSWSFWEYGRNSSLVTKRGEPKLALVHVLQSGF
jgi:endoglycosylceramidase